MVSRRQFIKLTATAAAVPLAFQSGLISTAIAAPAGKVPADDPGAVALKYVEIASDGNRTDKMGVAAGDQVCGNCRFYSASDTADWGGCALFQNQLVAKAGWCVGWVPTA